MKRFRVTPAARRDLLEIWEYLADETGCHAADSVLREIRDALERLAQFPKIGHQRDDLGDESLRVWPVHSYLVVYRPEQRPVEIVRVVSGYRDLFPLLAED